MKIFAALLEGLIRRIERKQSPSGQYTPFTTRFDLVVNATELDQILGSLDVIDRPTFDTSCSAFESQLLAWKTDVQLEGLSKVRALKKVCGDRDVVMTLLVDHSGSMRGGRMLMAAAAVEVAADFLSQIGVRYEILGFTTSSWRGGASRRAWKFAGAPRNPGRLCDLLHIVYRDADDTAPGVPWVIRQMLRPDLLKENVDGEALLWAADRLLSRPESRRYVIVVSDGAPVDDSTLTDNHPTILEDHLIASIEEVSERHGVVVGGVGVGYSVDRYYPHSASVEAPEDLGTALFALIAEMLTPQPTLH